MVGYRNLLKIFYKAFDIIIIYDIINYRFLTTETNIHKSFIYIFRCFFTTSSVKLFVVTVQIFVYNIWEEVHITWISNPIPLCFNVLENRPWRLFNSEWNDISSGIVTLVHKTLSGQAKSFAQIAHKMAARFAACYWMGDRMLVHCGEMCTMQKFPSDVIYYRVTGLKLMHFRPTIFMIGWHSSHKPMLFGSLRFRNKTLNLDIFLFSWSQSERIYNFHYGNGVPAMFTS